MTNSVIVIACPEADVAAILDVVGPAIRRSGGVCLISDAIWLSH